MASFLPSKPAPLHSAQADPVLANSDIPDIASPENASLKRFGGSSDQATATDANGDTVALTGKPRSQVFEIVPPRS